MDIAPSHVQCELHSYSDRGVGVVTQATIAMEEIRVASLNCWCVQFFSTLLALLIACP